ncbi:hypothetical protein FHS29_006295 [Saccharothrix tamanrassetensis]|uniref:Uncharacterized protein n=1 Tax=Saccharothrix tamanrassetensis TaxID=1051531 RepID=A0A841CTM9_9PSEU|nr:hypothetical protein [Saccharothrix tamanrassetensis]MBB5959674.1 hypothetical protein [Saccharothrix tamanrassetensis]
MELTGFDTHLLSFRVRVGSIRAFVDRIAEQWPDLLVSVSADQDAGYLPWRSGEVSFGDPEGEVYLVRDDRMRRSQEESGYVVDDDGASPIALYYNRAADVVEVRIVEEWPTGAEGQSETDAYPAEVVSAETFAVTLVTAEDPAEDEFARGVLDVLKECLRTAR